MRRIAFRLASSALALGLGGSALAQPGDPGAAAHRAPAAAAARDDKPGRDPVTARPSAEAVASVGELAQRAQASAARAKEAAATAAAKREVAAQHADALETARGTLASKRRTFNQARTAGKLHQRQHDALNAGAKAGAPSKGAAHLQQAEAELTKVTASGPEVLASAQRAAELEAQLAAEVLPAREAASAAGTAAAEARTAWLALQKQGQQLGAAKRKAAQQAKQSAAALARARAALERAQSAASRKPKGDTAAVSAAESALQAAEQHKADADAAAERAAAAYAPIEDALQRASAAAKEAQAAAVTAKQEAAKASTLAAGLGVGNSGATARATKEAEELKAHLDDAVTQLASVRARFADPAMTAALDAGIERGAAGSKSSAKPKGPPANAATSKDGAARDGG